MDVLSKGTLEQVALLQFAFSCPPLEKKENRVEHSHVKLGMESTLSAMPQFLYESDIFCSLIAFV